MSAALGLTACAQVDGPVTSTGWWQVAGLAAVVGGQEPVRSGETVAAELDFAALNLGGCPAGDLRAGPSSDRDETYILCVQC